MASTFPVYKYIISKTADPIFATAIGLGAAATRISKEEKAKGRSTEETLEAAERRIRFFFGLQQKSATMDDASK